MTGREVSAAVKLAESVLADSAPHGEAAERLARAVVALAADLSEMRMAAAEQAARYREAFKKASASKAQRKIRDLHDVLKTIEDYARDSRRE